jgi:hypothetical protein
MYCWLGEVPLSVAFGRLVMDALLVYGGFGHWFIGYNPGGRSYCSQQRHVHIYDTDVSDNYHVLTVYNH